MGPSVGCVTSSPINKTKVHSQPESANVTDEIKLNSSDFNLDMFFVGNGYPTPGHKPILNRQVFLGRRALINEHPYVVSIRRKFAHYLTGTLLSRNTILTVAHPIFEVPVYQLGVVAGQNYCDRGAVINTVLFVIIPDDFDPYTLRADLAVLRLYDEVEIRISIKSIVLSPEPMALDGAQAMVTGWGRCDRTGKELCLPRSSVFYRNEIMDPMLRTVSFTVVSPNPYCAMYSSRGTPLTDGMLCMGLAREEDPVAPCLAVPGAPLVINGQLVGIQSWGFGCSYTYDLPLVYTDISYHSDWLLHNIAIMHELLQENLTHLFVANRAYVMSKYLEKTRLPTPVPMCYNHTELVPLPVDKVLANFVGHVTDIRDYIYNKSYRESKQAIMDTYRRVVHRLPLTEPDNITIYDKIPKDDFVVFLNDTPRMNEKLSNEKPVLDLNDSDDAALLEERNNTKNNVTSDDYILVDEDDIYIDDLAKEYREIMNILNNVTKSN